MATKGCVYMTIGACCVARLIVSIGTLRRHYNGNITVLALDDENADGVEESLKPFHIDVKRFYIPLEYKRNNAYAIKPLVWNQSPYKITMAIDADTIIMSDVSDFLDIVNRYGVVVTPMEEWKTDGRRMSKRIRSFSDLISSDDLKEALNKKIAINTGVVGFKRGSSENFIKEWVELTHKAGGRFISDELACQCIFFKYPHFVADKSWNTSAKFGNITTAKIIHLHGRKHRNLGLQAARMWWDIVMNIKKYYPECKIEKWLTADKDCKQIISSQQMLIGA